MFFVAAKLVWFFLAPTNLLLLLALGGLLLLATRRRRTATWLLALGLGGLAICGFGPVGALLSLPLENRLPRPADPGPIAGIVVLGGATDEPVTLARDQVTLSDAGTRLTEAVVAARRFADARLVFSGGSGFLAGFPEMSEASVARRFFLEMGIPAARIELEDRSRDTFQNARFTRDLVQPKAGERWLLVTSALHMPRAVGTFRQAGFAVVPWPSGYVTTGGLGDALTAFHAASTGLRQTDAALREWIGLLAYRLTGRSAAAFPAP